MSRLLRFLLVTVTALAICALSGTGSHAAEERLSSRDELFLALETHTIQGDTDYQLILDGSLYEDAKSGINVWLSDARANCGIRSFTYSFSDRTRTLSLSNIEYRVAVRLLQAFCNNRMSMLSVRERQTLDRAIEVVRSAPSEQLAREQYLHDWICKTVTYYTDAQAYAEKDQAIGALLNGKADCDGYSEAFYLLCNLAGIPARFQHGDTYEKTDNFDATHMWNLVCVYDTWLMVDVTWDDADDSSGNFYLYYNIGSERAAETHIWNASALPVAWAARTSHVMRPPELVEGYANSLDAAEAYFRGVLTESRQNRVALTYAAGIDLKRDKELVNQWVYSSGVKNYYYKTGGHCIEILVTEWYDEFRIVSDDQEALAYVSEMKAAGKREFSIFFSGDYGKALFGNELAGFYSLEGQFGIAQDEMYYSDTAFRVSYSGVEFAPNFRVCRSEAEIIAFVDQAGSSGIRQLQFCVPGSYGASLFADRLKGLDAVLRNTLLANDRDETYSQRSQVVYIRDARYWPAKNRAPRGSLDAYIRQLLTGKPSALAVWNDGTFQWTEASFNDLSLAMYRSGVDTFRYILTPERVDFTVINYAANYRLVDSEDELLAYLSECRSRSQSSFRVYCGRQLYEKLSADRFDRFFTITRSVLRQGQSISYNDNSYMISMDHVQYK